MKLFVILSLLIDLGVALGYMIKTERRNKMNKIIFMNFSPNKNGHTNQIGKELLKNTNHDTIQMSDYKISQYDMVSEDDQIKDVFKKLEDKDTIVIGTPVYRYTVSGMLKTFIDRLYLSHILVMKYT